jgi:hypothetical protein
MGIRMTRPGSSPLDGVDLTTWAVPVSPEIKAILEEVRKDITSSQNPLSQPTLPRATAGQTFVGMAMPRNWVGIATSLPGAKTFTVAVALWSIAHRSKKKDARVRLDAATRRLFHLSDDTVTSALGHLEHAGLVRVDRHPGCRNLVTILPAPPVPVQETD